MKKFISTQVLIIGGGATGTGLARDLALRGITCLLVEKQDINAGASGRNHGLLHSGGRYVGADPVAAQECAREGALLRRLAPHCVEETGGLFVAVPGDDERYIADFPERCARCGIAAVPLEPREALELEPCLSPETIAAFAVEDAAVDPFRLSLDNLAQARTLGATLLLHHRVTGFTKKAGRIDAVRLRDLRHGTDLWVHADQIVNATGAWAGEVAAMAGAGIDMVYSQGSLIISDTRIGSRVINRLHQAADADILVPAGTVSIFGTTSMRVGTPEDCRPTFSEIDAMLDGGAPMVPELTRTRFIRAYAGIRPLVRSGSGADDREMSRGFALLGHEDAGLENFITITGGKLTTYRLMAEKTADRICERMGIDAACRTAVEPLPAADTARYTEPGRAAKIWLAQKAPSDLILCECEMVSSSVFAEIAAASPPGRAGFGLRAAGQRSRVGKGPCQGAFCSLRIVAHMYDNEMLHDGEGLDELSDFLEERWRGMQPLLWGPAVAQAELQEALHCGLLGLDSAETV